MGYSYNYGSNQPSEYQTTYGGDSTNGYSGSQTPQSIGNAAIQSKTTTGSKPADTFMSAATQWWDRLNPQTRRPVKDLTGQQGAGQGGQQIPWTGANPYPGQANPVYMPPQQGGDGRGRPVQRPPQQGTPYLTGTTDYPPSGWDLIGIPPSEWGPYAPPATLSGTTDYPPTVPPIEDPYTPTPQSSVMDAFTNAMRGSAGIGAKPVFDTPMNNTDPRPTPVNGGINPGGMYGGNVPLPSEPGGRGGYTSGWESYETPWIPPGYTGDKTTGGVAGGMNNTDPAISHLPAQSGFAPSGGSLMDAINGILGGGAGAGQGNNSGGQSPVNINDATMDLEKRRKIKVSGAEDGIPNKIVGQTQYTGSLPKPSFWNDATMGSWEDFQKSQMGQMGANNKDLTMNNGDPTKSGGATSTQTPMNTFDQWVAQQQERAAAERERQLEQQYAAANGGGTSTGTTTTPSTGTSSGTGTYTSTTQPLGGMLDPNSFTNGYLKQLEGQLLPAWQRQASEATRALGAQGALAGLQDSGAWANANADLQAQLASDRANQLTPMLFQGTENAQNRALQAGLGNLDAKTSTTNAQTQAGASRYGANQAASASRYGAKLGYDAQTSGDWLNYLLGNAGISQRDREALLNYNLGNRRIDSDVYGMDQRDRQYWASLLQSMGPEQLASMLLGGMGNFSPYPVVK